MKLTKEELDELFVYDETSSTCLRWKEGNEYGGVGEVGYKPQYIASPYLYIYSRKISIALIVWIMHGRDLGPDKALSPKDGNLRNVRIGNLQEVILYQTPL
ncbi:MAG: hypothetical protein ACRCUJ_12985 [Phocaeicola sp.]